MPTPKFIQIHTLTSYPATLLNRDDVGFAKRLPFGGATRTRISSQCLKRHWRTSDSEDRLSTLRVGDGTVPMSIRSRFTFQKEVADRLVKDGVDAALARAVTEALMVEVLGESAKAKKAKEDAKEPAEGTQGKAAKAPKAKPADSEAALQTGQITVLGRPEMRWMYEVASAAAREAGSPDKSKEALKAALTKERRENLRAMKLAAGLDAALFGRMVTSDILARGDAAVHVAHALTVHAEAAESDYFSAVDDLLADRDEGGLGSGHIGSSELTSGLFYGYVVVDVPLLVSNLEGCPRDEWEGQDRTLAGAVVERLIRLVATVSPGAKLGSTAPHAYSHLVLVEAGSAQPRTLANAFLSPVRDRDLLPSTYAAMAGHLAELDGMYGRSTARHLAALGPKEVFAPVLGGEAPTDLARVAGWASGVVRGQ